jgi:bacterioferritin
MTSGAARNPYSRPQLTNGLVKGVSAGPYCQWPQETGARLDGAGAGWRNCGRKRGERPMRGDTKVLQHLNTILRNELTAINQYFLHARMLRNWGVTKLGQHEYDESIGEMKHADRLIERILFLEGQPSIELDRLEIGQSVPDILANDLKLELKGTTDLKAAILDCEAARDFVSRGLLSEILQSEEESIDFLETQLQLIPKIGLENYIQLQSESAK